jgi:hypothetical protein
MASNVTFKKKLMCTVLSASFVSYGCKPTSSNILQQAESGGGRSSETDLVAQIFEAEQYALAGGMLREMISPSTSKKSFDAVMSGITQKSRSLNLPHIENLVRSTTANVYQKTGRLDYQKVLSGLAPKFVQNCKFALRCLTDMAELANIANLKPDDVMALLGNGAAFYKKISEMDEADIVKDIVRLNAKVINLHAVFIKEFSYPELLSKYGIPPQWQFLPSRERYQLDNKQKRLEQLEQDILTIIKRLIVFETPLAFADHMIKQMYGPSVNLKDESPEVQKNVLFEVNSMLIQQSRLIEDYFAFKFLRQRMAKFDATNLFNSLQFRASSGDPLAIYRARGQLKALMKFMTWESSLATRRIWARTVQRGAQQLGGEYKLYGSVAGGIASGVEQTLKSFLKNDPYFDRAVSTYNLAGILFENERDIVRQNPKFNSVAAQIMYLKSRQSNFNAYINGVKNKKPEDIIKDSNYRYRLTDAAEAYMRLMCTYRSEVKRKSRNPNQFQSWKLAPPYECTAPKTLNYKTGNFESADEGCRSNVVPLDEELICGTGSSTSNLFGRIDDGLLKRSKEIIWAPVISKTVIYSATALSIIATMGATSFLGIGIAGGATAAGGTAAATAQASTAAVVGTRLFGAVVGAAVFTTVNNALLLSTGVKKYDKSFWPSVGKEFLIGTGVMLVLPIGAIAGEALAAKATVNITNEFYKELTKKSVVIGVDALAFMPVPYAATAVINAIEGRFGETISDWRKMDIKEEALVSMLFALGVHTNVRALAFRQKTSLRSEIKLIMGR